MSRVEGLEFVGFRDVFKVGDEYRAARARERAERGIGASRHDAHAGDPFGLQPPLGGGQRPWYRKKRWIAAMVIAAIVIIGNTGDPDPEQTAATAPVESEARVAVAEPEPTPTPSHRAVTALKPTRAVPEGVPTGVQPAVVERIVDGDTIWARVDDAVEGGSMPASATSKVRLLEIDAPESTSTRECGGNKATAFVRRTIPVGTTVWLQADVEDTDRYDRFLRYVWLDDGRMLNRLLVRRGWAEATLYEPNDLHWRTVRAAQRKARNNDRGIWGDLCAPTPAPDAEPAPESAPEPEPEPAPEPEPQEQDGGCDPNYEPCVPIASDVDCAGGEGNGPAYVQGPVRVVGEDIYGLDGDGDGGGCEDG